MRDNTKLQAEAEKLGLRIELETTWIPGGRVARVVYRGDKRRYRGTADEVRTFLARCAAKALRAARERSYVETQPLANLPTDRAAREAWGLTAD